MTIQIARNTAANWTLDNPVLLSGEPALETDTGKRKYGDGSTSWSALPYASGGDGPWMPIQLLEGNTEALNGALVQAAIDSGEKFIQLPSGTFDCRFNMASGVKLRGAGIDETILRLADQTITDDPAFGGVINVHGTSGTHIENTVLSDLTLDGNKANIVIAGSTISSNIEGVDFLYADHCHSYRVRCINSVGDGFDYDECYRCQNHDCQGEGIGGYANHFSTNATECLSYGLSAVDCGVDQSRGGFDTHNTSSKCGYVSPRTINCYRGGYIQGDQSSVINHVDEASITNGLRLAASYCVISCTLLNTVSGNAMTIESGSEYNRVDGVARGGAASGFNFVSGANRNSASVTAEGCIGTGLVFAGDLNVARGCVLVGNGVQYSASGTGNLSGDQITT